MRQFPSINNFKRIQIVDGLTPMTRLDRLSEFFGIDLWIKRDDLAGPSFGGNKARQLEYYFGAASEQNADTVLITGAVQSNFARLAAAVAASRGMDAVVQLEQRVAKSNTEYNQSGNVLLNEILGARIIHYPEGEDEAGADNALFEEAKQLKADGRNPYVIPLGANKPPLGSLGYIRCAQEIKQQTDIDFDYVFVASGSGATHLGTVAGMKHFAPHTQVIGSCVRRSKSLQQDRLAGLVDLFNQMIDIDYLSPSDFHLWDDALAPGYGKIGTLTAEAIKIMARREGQILDPVYTAKVFAAIVCMVDTRQIKENSRVLFIHTGGLAATFAYRNELGSR